MSVGFLGRPQCLALQLPQPGLKTFDLEADHHPGRRVGEKQSVKIILFSFEIMADAGDVIIEFRQVHDASATRRSLRQEAAHAMQT
jgi:hypothetical protein